MNVCTTRAIVNNHQIVTFEVDVPLHNTAVNRSEGIPHNDFDSVIGHY